MRGYEGSGRARVRPDSKHVRASSRAVSPLRSTEHGPRSTSRSDIRPLPRTACVRKSKSARLVDDGRDDAERVVNDAQREAVEIVLAAERNAAVRTDTVLRNAQQRLEIMVPAEREVFDWMARAFDALCGAPTSPDCRRRRRCRRPPATVASPRITSIAK